MLEKMISRPYEGLRNLRKRDEKFLLLLTNKIDR